MPNKLLNFCKLTGKSIAFFILITIVFIPLRSQILAEAELKLFWSTNCLHCKNLLQTIQSEEYDKKINIEHLETSIQENQQEYVEAIEECHADPYIPLLYYKGDCFIGEPEILKVFDTIIAEKSTSQTTTNQAENSRSDQEATEEEESNNNINKAQPADTIDTTFEKDNISSQGKQNTEILIAVVCLSLAGLLGVGYFIEAKRKNNLKLIVLPLIFIFTTVLAGYLQTSTAYAICPVCTVAVGAGLGFTRYLGVDDIITAIWIGGLIVSTIYWILNFLENKNIKSAKITFLTTLITYLFVLIPLYLSKIIGIPGNTLWGIDKIVLGVGLGSIAFFVASQFHFYLKDNNNDKVYFPFQKVILPVGSCLILTIVFYFILYY